MTKLALALIACGTALVALLASAPAHAQLQRAWVSGTGNDANPCTRAQPCATFNTALAATVVNGEINCVDSGVFGGAPTITKSVTIDCQDVFALVGQTCTTGVNINIPVSASDPFRTVLLRNINIDGAVIGGEKCGAIGVQIVNAAVVSIEGVKVEGWSQRGIWDLRSGGGRLTVTNSILRYNSGSGLIVLPLSGSNRIDVAVDNVVAEGNGWGMVFTNGARAMVARLLIANNPFAGIDVEGDAQVALDNSTVSNNGTGLFTFGSTAVLDVSNSNIAFNAQAASGQWFSFGNNRSHRNTAVGTLPTAMGAITHDVGQM
jgi:hypothetical protein